MALVYDLTRGASAGRPGSWPALALALTPITVAMSRHNNPDALLVLCCVAALWCLVRGARGRAHALGRAGGRCVGLGFEAKMAAALMVVPAIAAAWLWVAPRGRRAAVRQLLARRRRDGGRRRRLAAADGAHPGLLRPWISGTSDNSIWSLILGYNGLGRLYGQSGGPGAAGGRAAVAEAGRSAARPGRCGC